MINLGRLKLKNPYLFAPMSKFSDISFRLLCEEYGASYSMTEQIRTEDFIKKSEHMKRILDIKSPCGIQFLSNSANELKRAISIIKNNEFYEGLENIKSIDLNLACPTKKTRDDILGSELLKHAKITNELFTVMKKYSHLPVSVKIRLALNSAHLKNKPYLRLAKQAEKTGIDFITIHGRTAGQLYDGQVNLEPLKEVAGETNIPLVGNGDIIDVKSANNMLEFCDAVMIGRHAVKEPFIFGELLGKIYKDKEEEKLKCIEKYLDNAAKYQTGFQIIKIHVQALLKDTQYFHQMMNLTHTKSTDDIIAIMDRLYEVRNRKHKII